MKLDVQVLGRNVAQLYRERDEYVLRYLDHATPADFVSLAMPVREEAWRWPRDLHPFFRQNLPEGYLLSVIREEFGPYLDGTDLSLLALLGGMGIGRVTVTPEGVAPGTALQALDIEPLLSVEQTSASFAGLVREYARAAVSGAVPKLLAPSAPGITTGSAKTTLRTSRYIVKGSDEHTPFLGYNEFYSMRVLERVGETPVARTRMSVDGRVLVVERFDVDQDGLPAYGLEDMCGLLGLPPHEKYNATIEQIVNAARAYLPAADRAKQFKQLGWLLLSNYVVRNADCHAKNIALYYSSLADVGFTPAYDIVSVQAYPRYADNPPGLAIDGRKTWHPGKTLERFFSARLNIPPGEYRRMVQQLCDAAVEVGREMIVAAKQNSEWHTITRQMLHSWNDGMESLRSSKPNEHLRALSADIAAADFSPAEKAPASKVRLGESELLARRR